MIMAGACSVVLTALFLSALISCAIAAESGWVDTALQFMVEGNKALQVAEVGKLEEAIEAYRQGVGKLPTTCDKSLDKKQAQVILSLYTQLGQALSYADDWEKAIDSFRKACICQREWSEGGKNDALNQLASKAYFSLGMAYQESASSATDEGKQREQLELSVRAYGHATKLDPLYWSSFANLGVVLADVGHDGNGNKVKSLEMYEEGILAYQKAIDILTGANVSEEDRSSSTPTDPPENVREVLAELNYRIGLCLVPFLFSPSSDDETDGERQCTLTIDSKPITRSCLELSAYQFNKASQYDPLHAGAQNALVLVTADASFGMSTDIEKVQALFEDYASNFETSLVDELNYNAFHRMRKGFDRALLQQHKATDKKFLKVVDAGCGTGLAGAEFRNISQTLIGVDLSPAIIEHAKTKRPGLYDSFQTGDIKLILRDYVKQPISLLVAADTFIYFNDLTDLFASMKTGIEEGGYAVFSLENVSEESEARLNAVVPQWRWQQQPSGRVAHRKQYVEDIAKANSFQTILYDKLDNFREEKGEGVRGHLFVLQKNSSLKNDEL
jgi:predicted TPR repeat methyltransferase